MSSLHRDIHEMRHGLTRDLVDREGATAEQVVDPHFDADAFCDWIDAHVYDATKQSPAPRPVTVSAWEREEMRKLVLITSAGLLRCTRWVLSWPRRHGKTMFAALYVIARAITYPDQVIVLQGNSEDQASQAALKRVVTFMKNSPAFHAENTGRDRYRGLYLGATPLRPEERVEVGWESFSDGIVFDNGSIIRVASHSLASAYGKKISCYWNMELAHARSADVYNAGAGSTGDSWCGLAIIDSTQGQKTNLVAQATKLGLLAQKTGGAHGDPETAVSYINYLTLEDAVENNLAPWLSGGWLRSRAMETTWSEFKRNHLNLPTAAGETAFSETMLLRACAHDLSPMLDCVTPRAAYREIRRRFRGGALMVGCGLDRSMGTHRGDRTVWATMAKGVDERLVGTVQPLYDDDGAQIDEVPVDPHVYMLLALRIVPYGGDSAIKRALREDMRRYGEPAAIVFESYQAKSLHDWAEDEGLPATLHHVTDRSRAEHVCFVHELLTTGRLALPAVDRGTAALLRCELLRYEETGGAAVPKYAGEKGIENVDLDGDGAPEPVRVKDDTVDAVFVALHGLRALDPDEFRWE